MFKNTYNFNICTPKKTRIIIPFGQDAYIVGYTISWVRCRLTNLDLWSPELLRTMMFDGNNRAQVFFKQHGWTDGGKIKAKYTSRAADLYREILAKAIAEDTTTALPRGEARMWKGGACAPIIFLKINVFLYKFLYVHP